ncbi:unnamed protein product [Caenorhabditis bovis]|uniref:Uncharacterized protein n=1 Tax=Caenorhabditis bovis TaxID=2654633 RepID=A0A8S1EBH3_9PELO|nr:unnamed protein product [Caenorhabditis bovis]
MVINIEKYLDAWIARERNNSNADNERIDVLLRLKRQIKYNNRFSMEKKTKHDLKLELFRVSQIAEGVDNQMLEFIKNVERRIVNEVVGEEEAENWCLAIQFMEEILAKRTSS